MSDLFGFKNAEFSSCRKYRYALWRWWNKSKPFVLFIGLNPSTADEENDDPTIRRCIGFAQTWHFGGLCMTNLFAVRATDPKIMIAHPDPIGLDNDKWIIKLSEQSDKIVAAWGTKGNYMQRDNRVCNLINKEIYCLEITKNNFPKHPLYIKKNATLKLFNHSFPKPLIP